MTLQATDCLFYYKLSAQQVPNGTKVRIVKDDGNAERVLVRVEMRIVKDDHPTVITAPVLEGWVRRSNLLPPTSRRLWRGAAEIKDDMMLASRLRTSENSDASGIQQEFRWLRQSEGFEDVVFKKTKYTTAAGYAGRVHKKLENLCCHFHVVV